MHFIYYFQKRRKEMVTQTEQDKVLLKKSSLDIKLLPESEEDKKLASLLLLNPVSNLAESSMKRIEAVIAEPAIKPTSKSGKRKKLSQPLTSGALGIIRNKSNCPTISKSETSNIPVNPSTCTLQNEDSKIYNKNEVKDVNKESISKIKDEDVHIPDDLNRNIFHGDYSTKFTETIKEKPDLNYFNLKSEIKEESGQICTDNNIKNISLKDEKHFKTESASTYTEVSNQFADDVDSKTVILVDKKENNCKVEDTKPIVVTSDTFSKSLSVSDLSDSNSSMDKPTTLQTSLVGDYGSTSGSESENGSE